MRMTTDRIPNTHDLQKEVNLPIGVIVKPFGEPLTVSTTNTCHHISLG